MIDVVFDRNLMDIAFHLILVFLPLWYLTYLALYLVLSLIFPCSVTFYAFLQYDLQTIYLHCLYMVHLSCSCSYLTQPSINFMNRTSRFFDKFPSFILTCCIPAFYLLSCYIVTVCSICSILSHYFWVDSMVTVCWAIVIYVHFIRFSSSFPPLSSLFPCAISSFIFILELFSLCSFHPFSTFPNSLYLYVCFQHLDTYIHMLDKLLQPKIIVLVYRIDILH